MSLGSIKAGNSSSIKLKNQVFSLLDSLVGLPAEKAAKTVAEKAGQKVSEITVEKGSKQIQQIL